MAKKTLKKRRLWLYTALALILGLVVVAEILVLVFQFKLENRVFPRTLAASVNISYLTEAEIVEQLKPLLAEFGTQPVELVFEGESYAFTLGELGISLKSAEEIAAQAPLVQVENNLAHFLANLLAEKRIDLVETMDLETARENLRLKIPGLRQAGRNARFEFDENWQLMIRQGKNGIEVDAEKLFWDLKGNIENLREAPVTVAFETIKPSITTEDLRLERDELLRKLGHVVTVSYDGQEWEIPLNERLDWLAFEYQEVLEFEGIEVPVKFKEEQDLFGSEFKIPTKSSVRLRLDAEKVGEFLAAEIKPAVEVEALDVKIIFEAGEVVEVESEEVEIPTSAEEEVPLAAQVAAVEAGKISFDGTAKDGRKVQDKAFIRGLELAFNEEVAEFSLPVQEIKAGVEVPEELQAIGVKELISTGYSDFSGSPVNRKHNIAIGMGRYNGLLISPDEVWSLNAHLGRVDGSTGYRKELVIKEGETIPEYGGGLCQVSSTFFRAILFGGFPVEERYPHHYAVSYYARPMGWGLDATIYPPLKDVKFINDSPGYILVQSFTYGNGAYFKFYGTDDGRTVEMDGPYTANRVGAPPDIIVYTDELPPGEREKVDTAHNGFEATWYRTVNKIGEEPVKETFFSRYHAWAAKYKVGKEAETE